MAVCLPVAAVGLDHAIDGDHGWVGRELFVVVIHRRADPPSHDAIGWADRLAEACKTRSAIPSCQCDQRRTRSPLPKFLHMCFAVPCEDSKINPVLARRAGQIFIRMPTTSRMLRPRTVRIAGSSGANFRSPASRPASPACGVRRMAAPMKRR